MTVEQRQRAWENASAKAFESVDNWIAKQQEFSLALSKEAEGLIDKARNTTDPDERDRLLKEASALQNDAFILNQEISNFRAQLNDAFRIMRGDLTSTELWDRVTAGESSKKMIQEIKEAARSTGEFTREQYAALDDVIIRMQEEGKINDPTEFLSKLKKGEAEAIRILNEYSDLITMKLLETTR